MVPTPGQRFLSTGNLTRAARLFSEEILWPRPIYPKSKDKERNYFKGQSPKEIGKKQNKTKHTLLQPLGQHTVFSGYVTRL